MRNTSRYRTVGEIREQIAHTQIATKLNTTNSLYNYHVGVLAALQWMLRETDRAPVSLPKEDTE